MSKKNRSKVHPAAESYVHKVCFTHEKKFDAMNRVMAITWRPGDQTSNFIGKALRPVGTAVLILLRYVTLFGERQPQRRMPLHGFRATYRQDNTLAYSDLFAYDAKRRPEVGAKGRVIDPVRNPTMLDTTLLMHRECLKFVDDTYQLPPVPMMPRVLLAYPHNHLPPFEETPALRQIVADRLDIRVGRLHTKQPELLRRMFLVAWEESILMPGQGINDTDYALIDAELVTKPEGVLRVYEDFSKLLGVRTWNPAREVLARERENPAREILRMHSIDANNTEQMNAIDLDKCDQMVREMRRSIGGGHELFEDSELQRALLEPKTMLQADVRNVQEAIMKIGEQNVCRAMRDLLPPILAEGSTNEDLLTAANNLKQTLVCSGACTVQALLQQKVSEDVALDFTPEFLGRKIHANLYRPWDRPRQMPKAPVVRAAVPAAVIAPPPLSPPVKNAPYQLLAGMHVVVAKADVMVAEEPSVEEAHAAPTA